jgi:hypothetical protein
VPEHFQELSRNPSALALFPLPLTPFESMMWVDDRPSHPMTCSAELTFEGHLDREKFDTAFIRSCLRHPLLMANVDQRWDGRRVWVPAIEPPQLLWPDSFDGIETSLSLDLRRESGIRLWVHRTPGRSKLYCVFHHACTDGAGCLGFLDDLLANYAAQFPGNGKALPKVNPELLLRRGHFDGANGITLKRLSQDLLDVPMTWQFFSQRPRPLAGGASSTPSATDRSSHSCQRSLSKETLQALRYQATATGTTVNDILLSALFQTIREWNADRSETHPKHWLRLLVPFNVRTRADLEMPAANRLSYVFLTRREGATHDERSLLQSVSKETTQLRAERMPSRVLSKLGHLDGLRVAFPAIFTSRRCLCTAIMSNLGDPTRRFRTRLPRDQGLLVVGDVRLLGLAATTPIRPHTRASFLVNTYGQQLTISARLDAGFLSQFDANLLVDQLVSRLEVAPAAASKAA